MAKTISANRGPITLNTPIYNPLTILSGVNISAPISIAVYGDNSQAWTISNAGTISSPINYGIELAAGGTVTNSGTAARISAGITALWLKGGPATAINQGIISGGQDGVILSAGGFVSNSGSAAISGGLNGVYVFGAAGVVTNRGTITGAGTNSDGVHFVAGGTVTNIGTASISGGQWGVVLTGSAAGTIINQGTISGGGGAVHFGNANGNWLYLAPGEVTNGLVQGGTGTDTLVLGGGQFGAISGIGSQFTGFELVEVTGVWLATGSNTIAAPTQLKMDSGVLKVGGTLTAPGNLSIASVNGTLAASDGGRVEVGTAGTARAGQIVIDAGHTLAQSGTYSKLAAPVVINRGSVTGVAGLYLASASSVTNSGTAAAISGLQDGVVAVFAETVTNQGSIAGGIKGVFLKGGGIVTNSGTAARITGGQQAVEVDGSPATVTNQGSISAAMGNAVQLKAGGTVTNSGTAASISGGGFDGVSVGGGAAVVTNQGTIFGELSAGVALLTGGAVANNGTTAHIVGGSWGVTSNGQASTVTNQGTIVGLTFDGVNLAVGGVVTNSGSAADIIGASSGVASYDAHTTVTNQGRITGTLGDGALLHAGGTVVNGGGGAVIAGADWGVYAQNGAATVTNQSRIIGSAADGVYLGAGGAVSNLGTSSRITGGQSGVYAGSATATVTNQGSIVGTAAYGVFLEAGGSVTNSGTAASIVGTLYGIGANRVAVAIVNQGSIFGNYGAIYLGAGGTVRNTGSAALISGGRWGIYAYGGVADTVTNQGTISGGNGAVHFDNANANDFLDFPGAVVIGVVQGGTGSDTLELGSAAATGIITGIGSEFTGFEALVVDSGAHWLMTGANTLSAAASIKVTGSGSLGVSGTLIAPGNLTVAGVGTLAANGGGIEVGTAGAALANQIVVDAAHTLMVGGVLSAATLSVASGGLVSGIGTVTGAVSNAGTIAAAGGALTIAAGISGSGTLQALGGALLNLNGASNTAASVLNRGTLVLGANNSLDVTGSVNVASNGLFILNNVSLLELAADTGASNAISFMGASGGTLVVDTVGQFGSKVGLGTYAGPKLENFATFDVIDLKNLVFGTATIDSYSAATGLLQLQSGVTKATLLFDNATLGSGSFHLGPDTGTGTVLTRS